MISDQFKALGSLRRIRRLEVIVTVVVCLQLILALEALASERGCKGTKIRVRHLKAKIERDQEAIRSLGFQKTLAEIEVWERLSEEARANFVSDAFDILLATADTVIDKGGSLSPPSANRVISKLKSRGINIEPLNEAIRKVAATPGKPARAEDLRGFIKRVQSAKDSISLEQTGDDLESSLEALSKVLGLFVLDSNLSFLAADLEFTAFSIYNNLTQRARRNQTERLTKLTEHDLKSLKQLSNSLRADVNKLEAATDNMNQACEAPQDDTPSTQKEYCGQPNPQLGGYCPPSDPKCWCEVH